jgi:hypothetical protein
MSKLCIACYVFGWYKDFIPLYSYSIKKSYPEYFVKVFMPDKCDQNIFNILNSNNIDNCEIIEGFNFNGHDSGSSHLRWLIDSHYFENFEYGYIGDIDFIIVKESPSLLESHINHCNEMNLSYSNIVREKLPKRMSGLHFFNVSQYFQKMDKIIKDKIENPPYKGQNNEEILKEMVVSADLGLPHGEPFRPHHGLHLGLYRLNDYKYIKEVQDREGWFKMKQGASIVCDDVFDDISRQVNPKVRNIMEKAKLYIKS